MSDALDGVRDHCRPVQGRVGILAAVFETSAN
jgi:hypothetical protein